MNQDTSRPGGTMGTPGPGCFWALLLTCLVLAGIVVKVVWGE